MSDDTIPVFNPLNIDFEVSYSLRENPITFLLRSKEATHIPKKYVDHVKKHLANKIFDIRGDYLKRRDIQMKEIMKEMEV